MSDHAAALAMVESLDRRQLYDLSRGDWDTIFALARAGLAVVMSRTRLDGAPWWSRDGAIDVECICCEAGVCAVGTRPGTWQDIQHASDCAALAYDAALAAVLAPEA